MQSYLLNLNEIIKFSKLELEEQEEFLSLFSNINDKEMEIFIDVFKDKPNWVSILYANYKAKQKALKENNQVAWREILQKEYNILKKIESSDY